MTTKQAHSIGTMIAAFNAKAAAAGSDLRIEHYTIDRTWGDLDGVALTGTDDHARGIAFVEAYFARHLASKRSYNQQYACTPRKAFNAYRSEVRLLSCSNGGTIESGGHIVNFDMLRDYEKADRAPEFTVTPIGIVYYPCAE